MLPDSTDIRSAANPSAPRQMPPRGHPRRRLHRACVLREKLRACRSCGARPPLPCCARVCMALVGIHTFTQGFGSARYRMRFHGRHIHSGATHPNTHAAVNAR
jgi:hypothetical protein